MQKMDFHVHVLDNDTNASNSIRYFEDLCMRNNLDGICIHAVGFSSIHAHPGANEKALTISKANINWYAFAGLDHSKDFIEQAEEYMTQGFRGIKLLEGKPSLYRYFGYGFEHPRFEAFFDYAEKHAIPLEIHNNDPLLHWDLNKISPSSIEKGWYYDSTIPSQEHFFRVFEEMLHRHPALHVALAHFGFYSNNLPRAEKLMKACPNLMMDMTPASIIYNELSQTPEETRSFILRYQHRLLYGTNVSNKIEGAVHDLNIRKSKLMNAFFEGNELYTLGNSRVVGMNLEKHVLENIYWNNAHRFMGLSL